MNTEIKTWADGYGRWHAEAPDTRLGLARAIDAITTELSAREPWYFSDNRTFVEENIISLPCDTPGRVHFAEYAIEE